MRQKIEITVCNHCKKSDRIDGVEIVLSMSVKDLIFETSRIVDLCVDCTSVGMEICDCGKIVNDDDPFSEHCCQGARLFESSWL